MSQQQFSNHTRFHPFYHYFLMPLTFGGLGYSAVHVFTSGESDRTHAILMFLAFVLISGAVALVRLYSLKVQDRVIRQEENFRHYLLAGKPLDHHLRTGQVVALRFASDAELVELAARAVNEKLSPRQIKESIRHWRADLRRV